MILGPDNSQIYGEWLVSVRSSFEQHSPHSNWDFFLPNIRRIKAGEKYRIEVKNTVENEKFEIETESDWENYVTECIEKVIQTVKEKWDDSESMRWKKTSVEASRRDE